jgi:hypothetical protein
MISVVLGSLLLSANVCPEKYSDEVELSKLYTEINGETYPTKKLSCGSLESDRNAAPPEYGYIEETCLAAHSGAQCCKFETKESTCIGYLKSDCPTDSTWCEVDVARSLSDEEIAAIVIGSIAAVGLAVAVLMNSGIGIMLLYIAYYIPLIVGFFLLYDPDLLTVYAPETQADANFRVVAVSTIVIVIAGLHLILGGLEAGSKSDMSLSEAIRARYRVPVNIVADVLIAVSLVLASVGAGLGSADEPGLFPEDNNTCHRVARALYYCPMHGYGLAAASLWFSVVGNLFCIFGRRSKSGTILTGYNLMNAEM